MDGHFKIGDKPLMVDNHLLHMHVPGPVYVGNIDGKLARTADCFLMDYDSVLRGQAGIDTYVTTYPSFNTFNYGFVYGDCGQPFVDLMKTNSAYMFNDGTVSDVGGHTMWSTKNTLSLNPESAYIRINSAPVRFRASGSYCAFTASYNGNSFTGNLGPYSPVSYDLAQYFDFSHLADRPIVSFNFKPASTQFKSISISGERWNGDFYKIE